jgi:5-carboxymethyl-2-hydroxymuconate isomerase
LQIEFIDWIPARGQLTASEGLAVPRARLPSLGAYSPATHCDGESMPHLYLDFTDNMAGFDPQGALHALNRALLASGEFEDPDIKSRAHRLECFRIGLLDEPRAFVHATLALLAGRSVERKQALADALLGVLRQLVEASASGDSEVKVQCCVEIVELDRASYRRS